MRNFMIYELDPLFPTSWIHIATIMEWDEASAIETARGFPGLRYTPLRATPVTDSAQPLLA